MLKTMKLYFDIPDKRCTIQIDFNADAVVDEKTLKGVSAMMGAPARMIDEAEFNRLSKLYTQGS